MDVALNSASKLCGMLANGEVGCLELLTHYLDRVERLNGPVNAVVTLDREGARARAAQADRARAAGESWGPLHGLPMTIKDSLEVTGMTATCGLPDLAQHRPDKNAAAVQRLVDAGAVIFGKTNLPVFAGDWQSFNQVFGTTSNPWNLERTPGGSSGGSAAALAAGFTGLELGSDIGGSIRIPAHFCGIHGHKPSHGIVSQLGHIPPPPGRVYETDLGVVGPLGRGARDLELALGVIAGPAPDKAAGWRLELPPSRADQLRDFRIAVWFDHPLGPIDTVVRDCLEGLVSALTQAGASVSRTNGADLDVGKAHGVYQHLLSSVMGAGLPIRLLEKFDAELPGLGEDDTSHRAAMVRFAGGRHRDWLRAKERQAHIKRAWHHFFQDYDVLLCPVAPTTAFGHDHGPDQHTRILTVNGEAFPYMNQMFWSGIIGVAELPATSAPIGLAADGLPVGVQIVGPGLEDLTPIKFAQCLEDITGGFTPPPAFT